MIPVFRSAYQAFTLPKTPFASTKRVLRQQNVQTQKQFESWTSYRENVDLFLKWDKTSISKVFLWLGIVPFLSYQAILAYQDEWDSKRGVYGEWQYWGNDTNRPYREPESKTPIRAPQAMVAESPNPLNGYSKDN